MKIIPLLAIVVIATSCNNKTPEERLLQEMRDHVKTEMLPKLKDPSSYSEAETKITDTVYRVEDLQRNLAWEESNRAIAKSTVDLYKGMNRKYMSDSAFENEKIAQGSLKELDQMIDSIKNVIASADPKELAFIVIEHHYRAKNGFGALDLSRFVFHYRPGKTDPKKKFFLFSSKMQES